MISSNAIQILSVPKTASQKVKGDFSTAPVEVWQALEVNEHKLISGRKQWLGIYWTGDM